MITVEWKGGYAFEATPPSGNRFTMDAPTDHGGGDLGPTPIEVFLAASAGCSGIDIVAILEKMRQRVTRYRIEIDYERAAEGQWPRPILSVTLRHILGGDNLDVTLVQKAVDLSDEKYCSVLATLRHAPAVKSVFSVE